MAYQCQQVSPSDPNLTRPYAEASQRFQTIPKRIPHPMEILQYDTVGKHPSVFHWTSKALRSDRTLSPIYSWN